MGRPGKASQVAITQTVAESGPIQEHAMGGGIEGADRSSRELMSWNPMIMSPDQAIGRAKRMADARSQDIVSNDGYATGAVQTHRDSIVGSQYRLNAQPEAEVLGASDGWAEEFQRVVEARFNLVAESNECYFDASGMNTLTGLVRLAVGGFVTTGEVIATAEWLRSANRPYATAVQLISPVRLSNPNGVADTTTLRNGIEKDAFGRPLFYNFRKGFPNTFYSGVSDFEWVRVPVAKPWGRRQVIHIIEQMQPDQSRGIADMVSALKSMKMTKKFQEVTLQNAVVNATYAAAIESELPSDMVFASMGAGGSGLQQMLGQYIDALSAYTQGGTNIAIDGVKMPHLFPGTKLNLKPMGTPGGVGTGFEESLLRHIAASLGLSYEQLSRDYTKTNYSSARASMSETWKFMQARKKLVADRLASSIYALWLEEAIAKGDVPLPTGMSRDDFYDPIKKEAFLNCDWIGASRGQIDEMKETQAAVMRINSGLSTYEIECARLGLDFRRIFRQRQRENRLMTSMDLSFSTQATKPGVNDAQNTMQETPAKEDDE